MFVYIKISDTEARCRKSLSHPTVLRQRRGSAPDWARTCEYLDTFRVPERCLILRRSGEWDKGKEKSKEGLMKGWEMGKERGKVEWIKGKTALQHSLGLGAVPNIIPPGEARLDGELRLVEIGWHPVAGMGGKWLAEQSGLGKMITKNIGTYPDPTQHWAVLVGDFVHQLWMDEDLDVIYNNELLVRDQWRTFEVGKTRFTDEALRQAGEFSRC